MYDPREARRNERRYYRDQRRYYRYQNPMRGVAVGIFLLALVIAFSLNSSLNGIGFVSILFVGLAFASLLGSASSMRPNATYGGMYGFIWLLGLALCFWIGFWPWILLPIIATTVLGSLFRPIIAGLTSQSFMQSPPMQQQQPYQQQPYQPENPQNYEQGYQSGPQQQPYQSEDPQSYEQGYGSAPHQPSYREGQQQYPYNSEPKQQYDQPQVQYPEQELPPMEEH